jgi:hypothetical protein
MTPEETAREQIDAMLVASGGCAFAKQNGHFLVPLRTRIGVEVERRLSVVEELESVVSANLQRANRLRQSILQKAFTGQL